MAHAAGEGIERLSTEKKLRPVGQGMCGLPFIRIDIPFDV